MMLHGPTLLIVQFSFTILTTILIVVAAFGTGRREALRWFAVGNVVATAGTMLGALTQAPLLIHAVLNYGLMCLGQMLVWRGLCAFCGTRLRTSTILALTALSMALAAWFAFVTPSLGARLVAGGMSIATICVLCIRTLMLHVPASTRPVMWVSAAGFAMFTGMMLLRTAILLSWGEDSGVHELMTNATRFGIPLAQVTVCFGLILLVTRQYAEELREASLTDSLTGALNRAGFEQRAQRILQRAQRDGRALALLMVDADHFKRINDEFGHPAGDEALRVLVAAAREALRPDDLLGRHGGEEFVALLTDLDPQAARRAAERLRAKIEATSLELAGRRLHLSVSIGLSTAAGAGYDLAQLVSRADAAVYRAKALGRNRVEHDEAHIRATAPEPTGV